MQFPIKKVLSGRVVRGSIKKRKTNNKGRSKKTLCSMTNQARVKCVAAAASGYFWKTITERRRRRDGLLSAPLIQRYSNSYKVI